MKKSENICLVNIIANDYLPHQSIFVEQFLKTNKHIDVFAISLENKDFHNKNFTTIKLKDIKTIDNYHELSFKYNVLELSTAIKPYAIRWLMTEFGYDKVLYFDSDILVYKSLSAIINLLDNHEVVLTPHIREPILDDKLPGEIDFTKAGYFNLGFIAFRKTQKTLSFLKWWSDKVEKYCYIDFAKYLFVDQRWIDFAPLFLDAHIIKEPGYNVAYFNLQEYIGKFNPTDITFMHFSGFNINKISVYQTRFTPESIKEYYPYFQNYQNRLNKYRAHHRQSEYQYAKFNNGIYISSSARKFILNEDIRSDLSKKGVSLVNPFNTIRNNSYFSHLSSLHSGIPVINALYYLYKQTPELQEKFPSVNFCSWNQSLHNLIIWFIKTGAKEYGYSNIFRQKQQSAIKEIKPFLASTAFESRSTFKNQFQRITQFLKILILPNKNQFLINIYLYFLLRTPEEDMFDKRTSDLKLLNAYKIQIINNLLSSHEYRIKYSSQLTPLIYRFLARLFLSTQSYLSNANK